MEQEHQKEEEKIMKIGEMDPEQEKLQ